MLCPPTCACCRPRTILYPDPASAVAGEQEPFLAIVVDPHRTVAAGKVEIGAFRTFPEVCVCAGPLLFVLEPADEL